MRRATAAQPKHSRALSEQQLLAYDRAEIQRMAELNRRGDPDPEPAAEAPAKAAPSDRSALAQFEAMYVSEELGITLADLVEHIKRDRPGIMAMAGPLGVTEEDLDSLLKADEIARELRALPARAQAQYQETAHEFVLRVRREWRAKVDAQPDPKAQFGQLPAAWEQMLAQFVHDGGTVREFAAMRGRVDPSELELPEPWPPAEAFSEYALGQVWQASGGTIEELLALPEADRAALLEAHGVGEVRL